MSDSKKGEPEKRSVDVLEAEEIKAKKIQTETVEAGKIQVGKLQKFDWKCPAIVCVAIAIVIVFAIIACAADYNQVSLVIIAGIASFLLPLILSYHPKCNFGTRLSKGEVRKSIVISFTIMFIILLSISFFQTSEELKNNTVSSVVPSNSSATIPLQAIGSFTQNFLYIYVIIIGFYFGSRLTEQIQTTKAYKNLKPLDILLKRYALGEIGVKVFGDTKTELEKLERDEKKEAEDQREIKFLHGLVKDKIITYDDYKKEKESKQKSDSNNLQNQKK
ncbi:MAG: hypothetical protein JW878_10225 [Methanomicrobia archaeon]|nr:hypothetical protein [Methanomicrobia archaeon]